MPNLKQNFNPEAGPGEHIIKCNFGYPGIAMGTAYLVSGNVTLDEQSPVFPPAKTPWEEVNALDEAIRRAEGYYYERLDKVNHLPIETRDEAKDTLETELLTLGELKKNSDSNKTYAKMAEQINLESKSAAEVIYQYYQTSIDSVSKMARELQYKLDNETNNDNRQKIQGQLSFLSNQTQVPSNLQKTLLRFVSPDMNMNTLQDAPDGCIPIANSIPVGDVIHFRNLNGKGTRMHATINTEGVDADHSNILMRSSRIAVARMNHDNFGRIRHGDMLIVDGEHGYVVINPTRERREEYISRITRQQENRKKLIDKYENTKWPVTKDGVTIKISANAGYSDEMQAVNTVNAGSIGLYRTEVAVLTRAFAPTEDIWYNIFTELYNKSEERAITLRTVDFEGDKVKSAIASIAADPARQQQMRRDQMRAALRVKAENPDAKIHMMIPMVRTIEQFTDDKAMMKEEAANIGIEPLHLGAMVETPAIVSEIDRLAEHADFLSIGSNDLIPHLLGYGRFDQAEAQFYDPTKKGIIVHIMQVQACQEKNTEVSLCGDLATNPRYLALLIGCGMTHISSGIAQIPFLKELVTRIDTGKAKDMVQTLLETQGRERREAILNDFNENEMGLSPNGVIDLDRNENGASNPAPENI